MSADQDGRSSPPGRPRLRLVAGGVPPRPLWFTEAGVPLPASRGHDAAVRDSLSMAPADLPDGAAARWGRRNLGWVQALDDRALGLIRLDYDVLRVEPAALRAAAAFVRAAGPTAVVALNLGAGAVTVSAMRYLDAVLAHHLHLVGARAADPCYRAERRPLPDLAQLPGADALAAAHGAWQRAGRAVPVPGVAGAALLSLDRLQRPRLVRPGAGRRPLAELGTPAQVDRLTLDALRAVETGHPMLAEVRLLDQGRLVRSLRLLLPAAPRPSGATRRLMVLERPVLGAVP